MDRMRALSWYLVLFNLAILIILTFAVYYRGGDSIPALQILLPVMILAGTGTNAWLLGEMKRVAGQASAPKELASGPDRRAPAHSERPVNSAVLETLGREAMADSLRPRKRKKDKD